MYIYITMIAYYLAETLKMSISQILVTDQIESYDYNLFLQHRPC